MAGGRFALFFSLIASFITVLLFVYTQLIYKPPLPDNEQEKAKLKEDAVDEIVTKSFKVDKLIVNLPSRKTRLRFLAITTHLMPFKDDQINDIERKEAQIKDIIIKQTSRFKPNELNTISGKIILESRLKKAINTLFPKKIVKDIHFSRFVVQ
ncbi:MAG: flagellar basal body-associated FliL family protein [Halobacteriovoraceae bacterium]|nr:flagellar basal body-associated FliL family protein [Halobacteriovoraceae bacterium]